MILTDLYQILFGKDHITDGSVIDFSEHGRQGGLSNKQGFKFTDRVALSLRVATNASLTFIGHAAPGTNATLPQWRIKAFTQINSGLFAEGSDNFDKVWDLRESYLYY